MPILATLKQVWRESDDSGRLVAHSERMLRARGRHRLAWGAMTQRRGVANHPSIAGANT
jgi:hypothetical protein